MGGEGPSTVEQLCEQVCGWVEPTGDVERRESVWTSAGQMENSNERDQRTGKRGPRGRTGCEKKTGMISRWTENVLLFLFIYLF